MSKRLPILTIVCTALALIMTSGLKASPAVGAAAPNFELRTLDGGVVELGRIVSTQTVVLVVLRGWPGYQCPLCTRQVNDFVQKAEDFSRLKTRVIFVYPGPADALKEHAQEFRGSKVWPDNFQFVLDPDYTFTNDYGLRWDAPKETAFPSTFIIERGNKVRFAHISKTHGDRTSADEVLKHLRGL